MVLTRRGRIVVFALAAAVLMALALTLGSSTSGSSTSGSSTSGSSAATSSASGQAHQFASVTVEPGQTLWDIAAAANPHGDIRHTVDRIMKLNSLPDASAVQMGEVIAVPVYK